MSKILSNINSLLNKLRPNKRTVSMKSLQVLSHLLLLTVGVLGIFLGILPDIRPDLANRPAYFAALESGLTRLGQFDYKTTGGKPLALLRPGDYGYAEIYGLLRVFDSGLLPLKDLPDISQAKGGYRIGVSLPPLSYATSGGELPVLSFVVFERAPEEVQPICFVRDLAFLVHDVKVRYWTRVGFAFAFVAVFLDVGLGLWGLLERQPRNERNG